MDNWLINVLALVLLCVVLDGARRAYLKHRDSMKVSRNLSRSMRADLDFDDDEEVLPPARSSSSAPDSRSEKMAEQRKTPIGSRANAVSDAEAELEYIDPEEAEKRRQIAAELPGSVRVVQRRKPEDASQINRKVQQSFQSSRKPLAGSKPVRNKPVDPNDVSENSVSGEPQQASLNLEEQVPTLMDSVVDQAPQPAVQPAGQTVPGDDDVTSEPHFASADTESPGEVTLREDAIKSETVQAVTPEYASPASGEVVEPPVVDRQEPSLDESVSLESLQQTPASDLSAEEPLEEAASMKSQSGWASADLKLPEFKLPEFKGRTAREPEKAAAESKTSELKPGKKKSRGRKSSSRGTARDRSVEEVLILNIMAPAGDYFEGNDLLRVLLSGGLRFGDMNIFHYHCGEAGEGPVLFSLANIVVPGTFDMSAMEDFTTPGVSLFLALPAEVEALKALDTLLSVARNISEQLGGELKDENRSVFTAQTAEHYRQRVMEFQRRKALAQAQA